MAEKYYQGEDIVITIEIFDEESLSTKLDLSNYDVDFLLYTSSNGVRLLASTDKSLSGVDVEIERVSDEELKLTISSVLSATLSPGLATVEIRVRDGDSGLSTISVNSSIVIESSNIGTL